MGLYNPAITFDAAYFTAGGFGGYTNYLYLRDGEYHVTQGQGAAQIAAFQRKGFSIAGADILILGSGPGLTVQQMRDQGANAWGLDSAQWAIDNDVTGGYVIQGDAYTQAGIDAASQAAGVTRWDCVLTEWLIECYELADTLAAVEIWRSAARPRNALDWTGVVHTVKPLPTIDRDTEALIYRNRTLAEWASDLAKSGKTQDWILNVGTGEG